MQFAQHEDFGVYPRDEVCLKLYPVLDTVCSISKIDSFQETDIIPRNSCWLYQEGDMWKLTALGVDAVFTPTKLYASGVFPIHFESPPMSLCFTRLFSHHMCWHDPQATAQPLEMIQGMLLVLVCMRRVPTKHSFRSSSCRSRSAESHALTSSGEWPRWARDILVPLPWGMSNRFILHISF